MGFLPFNQTTFLEIVLSSIGVKVQEIVEVLNLFLIIDQNKLPIESEVSLTTN